MSKQNYSLCIFLKQSFRKIWFHGAFWFPREYTQWKKSSCWSFSIQLCSAADQCSRLWWHSVLSPWSLQTEPLHTNIFPQALPYRLHHQLFSGSLERGISITFLTSLCLFFFSLPPSPLPSFLQEPSASFHCARAWLESTLSCPATRGTCTDCPTTSATATAGPCSVRGGAWASLSSLASSALWPLLSNLSPGPTAPNLDLRMGQCAKMNSEQIHTHTQMYMYIYICLCMPIHAYICIYNYSYI